MTSGPPPTVEDPTVHETPPPANKALLTLAAVLLAIPVIALLWVDSYAKEDPKLGPWPFFFWYQFLWVFLTAGLTYTSYRIVLVARPHRPMTTPGAHIGDPTDADLFDGDPWDADEDRTEGDR
ncbi:DUF3311 domain-containing protein [Mumia zhuanghuii]|uniref:DUF3311 domain-containing protein n=2 Tax=Mumia TaxID=1546255 RepID=A0ABW1QR88_9ACTN|nr:MULTISPECIES: DUF3311 domain-containing protein [Mumia]KAA1424482.1 DUF3311 domain-containing protein [Mumia zhuanghuii]